MRERRFVSVRRRRWDRLAALVDRAAGRGVRSLSADEIDELALAYRAATSDLAIARSRGEDPVILDHLNRLTARAHSVVYVATARTGWSRLVDFAVRGFPREVRRSWAPIAFCALVSIASAWVAYASVAADPANAHALMPGRELPPITKPLHDTNFGFDTTLSPAMSSLIITNNVQVAAMAFAGGITGGLLTAWIILTNGLMVGALAALYAKAGFGADFWATIAPHGVIELSAIQIAGGAGLVLAGGLPASGPRAARRRARARGAARGHARARRRHAAVRRRHDRRLRLAAALEHSGARHDRRSHGRRAAGVPARVGRAAAAGPRARGLRAARAS